MDQFRYCFRSSINEIKFTVKVIVLIVVAKLARFPPSLVKAFAGPGWEKRQAGVNWLPAFHFYMSKKYFNQESIQLKKKDNSPQKFLFFKFVSKFYRKTTNPLTKIFLFLICFQNPRKTINPIKKLFP